MRIGLLLILLSCFSPLSGQVSTWSWGGKIAFHCSRLNVFPGHTSSIHTSPAFGLYLRSPETNRFLFEIQTGYESVGANKEFYAATSSSDWLRIYDKYRTIPVSVMYYRHVFFSDKLWIGIGVKGQYVYKASTRNSNPLPPGTAGIIYNPDVNRMFGSACGEIMYPVKFADICLTGSYGLTPLIDDRGISAFPYTLALTVKKRLIAGGRYGDF